MMTFAMAGPSSRTTQLFINFGDNSRLDGMKFAPFGKVREPGMSVVDQIYSGYGEGAPMGRGPNQAILGARGNAYLDEEFPNLTEIKRAYVLDEAAAPAGGAAPSPATPAPATPAPK
jgi:peptidyl-prolyl cis-trans isomerase A (cyclophilin A)